MKKYLLLSLCTALSAMVAMRASVIAQPPNCGDIALADGTRVTCIIVTGVKV